MNLVKQKIEQLNFKKKVKVGSILIPKKHSSLSYMRKGIIVEEIIKCTQGCNMFPRCSSFYFKSANHLCCLNTHFYKLKEGGDIPKK